MRILRIRRGFTTNSSSGNEYVDAGLPAPRGSASAGSSGSATGSASSAAPSATPTAASPDAGARDAGAAGRAADAGPAPAASVDPSAGWTPPADTPSGCSGPGVVTLAIGVVLLFAVDRVVRAVRRLRAAPSRTEAAAKSRSAKR